MGLTPNRSTWINGHKVEEFYWNRKMVVYIDDHLTNETYCQACERLEDKKDN